MIRLLLSTIPALFLFWPAVATERYGFDPISAYGDRIEFEVLRNGDPIGRHTVDFLPRDGGVQVDAEMNLQIRFLGLTVYRFGYRSSSLWREGRLVEMEALTDDDGEQSRVTALEKNGRLRVSGPAGELSGPLGLFTTDHWNPGVRGSDAVINTITGQVASVIIRDMGADRIEMDAGSRDAARHVYSGDLHDVEVWYDRQGRWVRLRFPDKSGGVIDYRCIRCGMERTAEK